MLRQNRCLPFFKIPNHEVSFTISGFMMNLFTDSQRQFHRVFTQTYGVLYERNARLFKEYFYQLKRFFLYGKVNLHESTATFFSSLYQKMFQVNKKW